MLAYLFLLVAIIIRFLPHTFGFTPVGASLLFFGAHQPRKRMWIPLCLMLAADIGLNVFVYHVPAFAVDSLASTLWYALAILLGGLLKRSDTSEVPFYLGKVAGMSLAGSLSFFLISNFAVWLAWPQTYAHTWAGLLTCYTMAIPFFRLTPAADLIYAIAFFSAPLMVFRRSASMEARH